MLKKFVRILGGDPHQKRIREFAVTAAQINALEDSFKTLSDEELQAKTREFRLRLARGESLDDILPEAYATVREASSRTIGLRHYDIQLIGGIALHKGIIAEMRTGEGKTLVATLPLYLNALSLNPEWVERARQYWGDNPERWVFEPLEGIPVGRGVHLVTVNDYLARRDARWMAKIYDFLGLSVGVLQMASRTEHGQKAFLVDLEKSSPHEDQNELRMVPRKEAYNADITYGTNNEFGFDYLRDNTKMRLEDRVQRGHYYAIIDEVDNVLIDEARTPLIISGPSHEGSDWYVRMAQVVKQLRPEDYELSVEDRTVTLTEVGETHVEQLLGMELRNPERPEDVTPEQARIFSYLEQALRAEFIYKRNKEYIVQAGRVIIVDEFTGRLMPGRRWSDGLHQAVEAKEGVRVQSENVTYATITIQNYFRMYEKLAGMTGTAVTESEEFMEIYNLETLAIPTNLEYQTMGDNPRLLALEGRDQYNYKYTYYVPVDQPDSEPLYWKRKDYPDQIYRTEEAKLRAIVREIISYHVLGRPILVGTTSVELSERVSKRLKADMVRRLAQVLLIRDEWLKKNNRVEDGRQIPELTPLNTPLNKLTPSVLRKLIRAMELEVSLNPEDDTNLARLLALFDLSPAEKDRLAGVLRGGIPHQVLNARKHTEESQIIAGAGAFGAVTIATNMAGRGVDIILGGFPDNQVLYDTARVLDRAIRILGLEEELRDDVEALSQILKSGVGSIGYGAASFVRRLVGLRKRIADLPAEAIGIYNHQIEAFDRFVTEYDSVLRVGGLHVIGSERHEARRIDNQLRGRAARQGDPGSSRFYLSLEDELMVRFGGPQMESLLARLNVDESLPIENNLVNRIVESSQTRVEGANFDVRKHLLEYDDVLNTQRTLIYNQRDQIFLKDDLSDNIAQLLREEIAERVPQALEDEGGPWKLLSWLEQIQPPLTLRDGIFPSYTLKVILEHLLNGDHQEAGEHPLSLGASEARELLIQLARDSIQAEKEHILQVVRDLLDQTLERLDSLLDERLETLEMFIEGITLDEEAGTRNPQELATELKNALRLPIQLSRKQIQLLSEDPEEVEDALREKIEIALTRLTITRTVGAIERILKESLNIDSAQLYDLSWNDISQRMLDAVEGLYAAQIDRLIGNGTPGQLVTDLDTMLGKRTTVTEQDLYNLMTAMRFGRRATFDKKTHRRVWMRTTRLTYFYLAARLLEDLYPEEITDAVLAHLEDAQLAIREDIGESEIHRLAEVRPADLGADEQAGLERALGKERYAEIQSLPFKDIQEEHRQAVILELGRQGLTKVYRQLLLSVISNLWVEYLTQVEALRVSIGLEAYAQRNPLVEYKNKAFVLFQQLLENIRLSVIGRMFTFQVRDQSAMQANISKGEFPPPAREVAQAEAKPQPKKRRRRRRRR